MTILFTDSFDLPADSPTLTDWSAPPAPMRPLDGHDRCGHCARRLRRGRPRWRLFWHSPPDPRHTRVATDLACSIACAAAWQTTQEQLWRARCAEVAGGGST